MTAPRQVPEGAVKLVLVLVGLALIVVGLWARLGWEWGLVALGCGFLALMLPWERLIVNGN